MKLREFEDLARAYWDEIPDEYKEGIDGVRVLRRAKAHDELPDVYTMGECVTETYPSDFGGPETTRSAVVLYHGSFAALAELDPAFDWEEEAWETLTHELRHHLESLANEDALEDVDYAADENFKRYEGEPFDPAFYQLGEQVFDVPFLRLGREEPRAVETWRVEGDWFFQLDYPEARPPSGPASLEWGDAFHVFDLPVPTADVTFVVLRGGFAPRPIENRRIDEVCLVLVRRTSALRAAANVLLQRTRTVEEIEVDVTTSAP